MSDIDRVFARLGGGNSAASKEGELQSVPRRGRASTSRVVEVVRLKFQGALRDQNQLQHSSSGVRAQTWPNGFPTRSTPAASAPPQPPMAKAPEPVGHLMPMRSLLAERPLPPAPADAAPERTPAPARLARRQSGGQSRRIADPFDPNDEGANCQRCGYAVEPARERRGLMTCAPCG
jgi:hypothetical protein